ncbi:diguanylate cyclase (GGDEF) domain [endosymbiont of Ridgeia piscesae]|uniref:diguanylate cyclase n=2 Tax=endosymbiont of Ridgeia piscesae TaxID=54398 RepID=A0A0T5ZB51_9GAMM|nr:diguanylate cyclase (GGDEF) domain [endosymbiont of Ridgeia piscesae]KRT60003.1 diguanylate cyclase (GGDEF) domain-containing protein [endosymbiont of Ridgeia piscesae]
MRDMERENRHLKQRLKELSNEARRNETTLNRFHQRELELLSAGSLAELLQHLTDGMRRSMELASICLLLEDRKHHLRDLLNNNGIPAESFPAVRLVDDLQQAHPHLASLQRVWLGPFLVPEHAGLFDNPQQLQSIALLPIPRRGKIIGWICMGSRRHDRFTRHHASDFIEHLATVSGVCLENAANRERLLLSGFTDPLTELYNRRYLDRRLPQEISRSHRYHQPLSCLFVDADHFKQINDQHGHSAGDQVLQELARRLREQLRASDLAIRYGGEEFTLLLPHTTLEEALRLAERIRQRVEREPVRLESGQTIPIRVSIGAAQSLPPPPDLQPDLESIAKALLENADQALYLAKSNGRNRVECINPQARG